MISADRVVTGMIVRHELRCITTGVGAGSLARRRRLA